MSHVETNPPTAIEVYKIPVVYPALAGKATLVLATRVGRQGERKKPAKHQKAATASVERISRATAVEVAASADDANMTKE